MARCDGKKALKRVKTLRDDGILSWTVPSSQKVSGAKMRAKTSYKARVKAYVLENGVKKYVESSPVLHAYTSGYSDRWCNPKGVNIKSGSELAMKEGETSKIKATVTKVRGDKTLIPKSHAAKIRYMSSSKEIATVSSKGKITAVSTDTCYIYVYAVNGAWKKVKVTVE